MIFKPVEKIADAVLFEGYMLYPYRASSIKNRQRWNFGTLYARGFAEAQRPEEPSSFHAEVLIKGGEETRLDARVRFLQLAPPRPEDNAQWEQGLVRARTIEAIRFEEISKGAETIFDFSILADDERAKAPEDFAAPPCMGRLTMNAQRLSESLHKVSVTFSNETHLGTRERRSRMSAQSCAFASAHLLLHVSGGAFVSLLEPDAAHAQAAAACSNRGVFPVLVGEEGDRSRMLCSPIVLYDYPRVAPESAGDYFDSTEMDEMLALRVMTLTEDEKREMREGDPQARAILERTEALPAAHMMKIHGAIRGMSRVNESDAEQGAEEAVQPWNPFDEPPPVECVRVFGVEVRKGDRVRLWPQKTADILDLAMKGKIAIVESIEQDLEDNLQFAVVLEDDPGRDMGMLRQAGHRFFFSPDEVEPMALEVE